MNDREKLIELLDHVTRTYRFNAWENTDKIADYLIANGVTFPKHERWEPVSLDDQYEGMFKCSGCKTEQYFGAGYPSYYDGSYCPNCGAKMDKEE